MRIDNCPICGGDTKEFHAGTTYKCQQCGFEFKFGDMLKDITRRNKLFTDYVRRRNPLNLPVEQEVFWLVFNALAVGTEWGEFAQEVPWKWWKGDKELDYDKDKIAEELVDMIHFMFAVFDEIGYDPDDIWAAFVRKNEENWKRFKERWGNEES